MLAANVSTRIQFQDSILGVPLVEPQDIANDCRDLGRLLKEPQGSAVRVEGLGVVVAMLLV